MSPEPELSAADGVVLDGTEKPEPGASRSDFLDAFGPEAMAIPTEDGEGRINLDLSTPDGQRNRDVLTEIMTPVWREQAKRGQELQARLRLEPQGEKRARGLIQVSFARGTRHSQSLYTECPASLKGGD